MRVSISKDDIDEKNGGIFLGQGSLPKDDDH